MHVEQPWFHLCSMLGQRIKNYRIGRDESNKEVPIMRDKKGASPKSPQPHRVRLPGFVTEEDIGLGDVVKRMTYAIGIKPCGGCEARAAALNGWMVFSGPHSQ